MTAFFLVISLFLNILALFAIVILFLRQNKLVETEKKIEKMNREIEDSVAGFLVQMKEENEHFINKLKADHAASPNESIEKQKAVNQLSEDLKQQDHIPLKTSGGKLPAAAAAKVYKQNTILSNQKNEESLADKAWLLKEKGLSEGEIAKALNKGKTEISLLLKFHQKTQE